MAEDLFKETQHVVENEIIREMLPSLADVKKEVLNYYDSEFESTSISVQNKEPLAHAEIEAGTFHPLSSGLTVNENSQKLMNCNKIILGSKPNRVSKDGDDLEKSAEDEGGSEKSAEDEGDLEKSAKAYLSKDVYFANGSKLNGVSIDENYFEELVTSYEPSVVLQDIHSYLRKSKRFCDTCSILFAEPNGFNSHMQIFHPEEYFAPISSKQSDLNERRQHKCTVCAKLFVAGHVLRRHLINIHKLSDPRVAPNTSNVINAKELEDTTKDSTPTAVKDTRDEIIELVVENTIKETNAKASEHIIKNTTTKEIGNATKCTNVQNINPVDLPSNSSNTCFHCKKTFDTQKSLIEHLYDVLQMKRKNTEIVPVLKSVLFKCHKCDINFTTSQLAANHTEHMEMLINWKCNICNRIFKKEDELSHERQHSVSNNFLVYNLGDIDVTNILFRCSKCATHFTESNFLYHFRDCGLEVTKSVICNICNISLDYNLKTLHEFDKHTESKLFTIIQCDVISDNPVNTTANKTQTKEKLKEVLKSFREVKIVLQKIDSKKLNNSRSNALEGNIGSAKSWRIMRLSSIKKREHTYRKYRDNYKIKQDILKVLDTKVSANIKAHHSLLKKRNLAYSYCETCKCFITTFRKAVHVQGLCKNSAKIAETCKYCGLILTSASIVTHRRLHEENRDLKLKDFRFFNLSNGRFTNPPIPEYPKCAHCAVHFLTKSARIRHRCSEQAYQTCNLCKIKLSEPAFKLHMAFHQYTTDSVMKVTSKNSQAVVKEGLANENATKTTDKDHELIPNMHNVSESKPITTRIKRSRQYKLDYRIAPDASPAIKQKKYIKSADHLLPKNRNLIYSYCDTCKCFITKFKKAIHLEGRCKNLAEISDTCKHCGLILTRTSIDTHKRLHEDYKHLKLKNFKFIDLHSNRFMNPPIPEYPKCAHCVVHFLTKTARDNHICSKEAYQMCHFCDIKFTKVALQRHMMFHRYETDRTARATTRNPQPAIALDFEKPATKENENNIAEENTEIHTPFEVAEMRPTTSREAMNPRRKCEISSNTKLDAIQVGNKKRRENIPYLAQRKRNYVYSYCETCKCFVTKFRKTVHKQGHCKKMPAFVGICKYCGLILTRNSVSTHLKLHAEKKDLTLKNFKFINLYNGRSVNPPIPEYPKCSDCEIHFLTKIARDNHTCSENAYQTCQLCQMKLTETAFKFHMEFHQYATNRVKKVTSNNSQTESKLDLERKVNNDIDLVRHSDASETKSTTVTEHMNTIQKYDDTIKPNNPQDVNKKRVNTENQSVQKRRKRKPIYSYCKTCKCFITKFKKTVHLQGRCKNLAEIAETCKQCGLIFTKASILTHRRLHEEYKDLNLMDFRFVNIHNGRSINPPIPEYPKCAYCSVHFLTKTAKNNHTCSEEHIQTCHLCEMTLSKAAFTRHMMFHQYITDIKKRVTSKNFQPAITLDVEKGVNNNNATIVTEDEVEFKQNSHNVAKTRPTTIREQDPSLNYTMDDEMKLNAMRVVNKDMSLNIENQLTAKRRNLTYYYCEICKCFITRYRKDIHIQERCKNLTDVPDTCEHCGLILSGTSIVTHRRLHEEDRDLNLKNFKFLDLHNGLSVNPPIPEYPKCAECAVHFLTKTAMYSHICHEEAYETCRLCDLKLSEPVFKCHMAFHQYPTDRIKRIEKRTTSENVVTVTTGNEIELTHNSVDMAETSVQISSDIYEIVYTCRNCSVSLDTYDKVVEHCQRHYEKEGKEIHTENCNYCELTIDTSCYKEHVNLHEKGKQFELLKFDSYYLPAENHMWVKHIFNTLPGERVLDILRNSVYGFECRIKMEIIQQGDPNLTVYKCDQCSCFIDPGSLFKHSENSCFKLRRHPCTVCGILYNSSASRIDHEKIHNRPGITTDSYRIVVFNRERDKQVNRSFCLRKNYVLFQCRSCGMIIDKLHEDIHQCEFYNVKKCPQCALLLHTKDFERHVNKHEDLVSFTYSNMKVILLGEENSVKQSANALKPDFKGAIYDYKMFVCYKCEICIKNEKCMSNHICQFGRQRLKCFKCELYFSAGRMKTHTRCHEQDPDFVRSNMNIISFDSCTLDLNKNSTIICNKDCELSDSNSDSEILATDDTGVDDVAEIIEMTSESVEEEIVKVYKCICGLHFLNEDSINRHFGVCRSKARISEQKCPKCGLLFTPNILFTHLLAHHSNKSRRYKYDIIEMDHTDHTQMNIDTVCNATVIPS